MAVFRVLPLLSTICLVLRVAWPVAAFAQGGASSEGAADSQPSGSTVLTESSAAGQKAASTAVPPPAGSADAPAKPEAAQPEAAQSGSARAGSAHADGEPFDPATSEPDSRAASDPEPATDTNTGANSGAQRADAADELPAVQTTRIVYHLQRVDVRGNEMRSSVIAGYVPFKAGDELDPDDPRLSLIRFQLMGTGFFEEVKLSLERGGKRGWVVLVIEVRERNTLVIERIVAGLSRVVKNSSDKDSPVRPYAGLGIAERNLFGTGVGVAGAGVASLDHRTGQLLQYGLDLRLDDVDFFNSGFDVNVRLFHNHAREFFGRNTQVVNSCPPPDPEDPEATCDPDIEGRRAGVIYDRSGVGVGAADDLGTHVRYSLSLLGERVAVLNKPTAANTQRGRSLLDREPIDFRIEDGVSTVSSVELGILYDTRNHPSQPTRGDRLHLLGRLGLGLLGSDYDFARAVVTYEHLMPLPMGHVLQLGLLAGSVFGNAPFFYRFYAADLSDLLPSRQLELNLDHRRTHNLLGTSIREMDAEEVAARAHAEYRLPLRRSGGAVRAVDAYMRVGLFLLARREDLRLSVPGYRGLSRVPLDLTFDFGIVADTDYGLFKIGFSSLIGFLPDLGQDGS